MIRPGIRNLFRLALRRPAVTGRDVDDEIRFHTELRAQQLVAQGLTPAQALAQAELKFGMANDARQALHRTAHNREHTMQSREWWDAFGQDVRYAVRGLRREPGYTAFVAITLALGIGANAAMFGVVDRLLLRGPEHVQHPEQLARFYRTVHVGPRTVTTATVGYVSYAALRDNAHSLAGVAAYNSNANGATFGRGTAARLGNLGLAAAGFFPLLGVRPVIGRFFTERDDDTATPAKVVVLGHSLWMADFNVDSTVLGKDLVLNDEPFTIVGVAPKGFTGPELGRVDAWIPMSERSRFVTTDWTHSWNAQWLRVLARVKPGVSNEIAGREADALWHAAMRGAQTQDTLSVASLRPIAFTTSGAEANETRVSRWLVGVAGVVLLIACANAINLLLARAVRRRRELAVRLALGAGRRRLVRLLLTESLILAMIAGVASLAVAFVTGQVVRVILLPNVEWTSSPLDARVLGLTLAMAMVVGVVVGIVPALQASAPNLTSALKTGARDGGGNTMRLRGALTVAQAALSVVLLVGAGLFVRSLWQVREIDLGLQHDRVVTVSLRYPPLGRFSADTAVRQLERARRNDVWVRALEQLRSLPGVAHAGIVVGLPFQSSFGVGVRMPGRDSIPNLNGESPHIIALTAGALEAMGTRLIKGRAFTDVDREKSEPVALVNETMAATLWPGQEAIGEYRIIGDQTKVTTRVVGVVANARTFELKERPSMQYYIPFGQESAFGFGGSNLMLRPSRGEPSALIGAVRRAILALDPSLTYVDAKMLQESLDLQIRPWRLGASMFGLMGVLALIVAAVGLYSVMSYLVAQRTRELGIRIALGATSQNVVSLILRGGVRALRSARLPRWWHGAGSRSCCSIRRRATRSYLQP